MAAIVKKCCNYFFELKLFLILIFILTSCENVFDGYVRNGIGTSLYSKDLQSATKNQDIYFGYICHQSGIAGAKGSDGFPRCRTPFSPRDLTLLVHTGFNDIDRRCDGYLAWLEDARHRDAFYNSQLNQVARLTNSILAITSPEAGVTIGIVAEAFGYAQSVFSDYQTRIMLGYESSTIKTIVTQRRLNFRNEFSSQEFKTKPDAVFVLRSYLRICMPYTITMDANTYARAVVSGNKPPNYENAKQVRTAISPARPLRAAASVAKPNRARKTITDNKDITPYPKIARAVQKALCVTPDGEFGPKTVEAIRIFQRSIPADPSGELDDKEQLASLINIGDGKPCNKTSYRNYLERSFSGLGETVAEIENAADESDFIKSLGSAMQKKSSAMNLGLTVPNATTINALRTSISEFKDKLTISKSGSEAYLNKQITGDFMEAIGYGN